MNAVEFLACLALFWVILFLFARSFPKARQRFVDWLVNKPCIAFLRKHNDANWAIALCLGYTALTLGVFLPVSIAYFIYED